MTEARIELPPPEPKRCNCAAHSAAECVCGAWEEGPSRDQLEKALAECRDAFPIPPPGAPHEHAWGAAMGDPLSVPHYVRAAIAAVGVRVPVEDDPRLLMQSGPFKGKPQQWFTRAEVIARFLPATDAERPQMMTSAERYERIGKPLEEKLRSAVAAECTPHPDAPHGFNRNASHNAGRYVCDCEGWAPAHAGKE